MKVLTDKQIAQFIFEDAPQGDITTSAVFGKKAKAAQGILLAKQDLVLSGLKAISEILKSEFPSLKLKVQKKTALFLRIVKSSAF